eukprot:7154648-Pyramimonas_sp.AAC.1
MSVACGQAHARFQWHETATDASGSRPIASCTPGPLWGISPRRVPNPSQSPGPGDDEGGWGDAEGCAP